MIIVRISLLLCPAMDVGGYLIKWPCLDTPERVSDAIDDVITDVQAVMEMVTSGGSADRKEREILEKVDSSLIIALLKW